MKKNKACHGWYSTYKTFEKLYYIDYHSTNNYKKMHKTPMKRKRK